MDKRYQVFVSSTYEDLKEEREAILSVLMKMDYIPSGMELFPAADEEQWEYIKSVIDKSDYYLLIIGGRYGSLDADGIGFTEKEYDYAVANGVRVVALIHKNPEIIPAGKSEKNTALIEKLETFRKKVSTGRLVEFWSDVSELKSNAIISLRAAEKRYSALGWVRAHDSIDDVFKENYKLRAENKKLRDALGEDLSSLQRFPSKVPEDIADWDDEYQIRGYSSSGAGVRKQTDHWGGKLPWGVIFELIAPHLIDSPTDHQVNRTMASEIYRHLGYAGGKPVLNMRDYKVISIQLRSMGVVKFEVDDKYSGRGRQIWHLTDAGRSFIEERIVHKAN